MLAAEKASTDRAGPAGHGRGVEAPKKVALGVFSLIEPAQQGLPIDSGGNERTAGAGGQSAAQSSPTSDIASVLRRTFQATLDETVPDQMLDLLSKLS